MDKKYHFWHLAFVYHLSHDTTAFYSRQRKLSPFLHKSQLFEENGSLKLQSFLEIAARKATGWMPADSTPLNGKHVVSSLLSTYTLHLPSGEISPTRFRCCSLLTAFGALAKLYGSLSTSISALKVCCKVQFSKKNLKDFKGCKLILLPPT